MTAALVLGFAYLLGSIPVGYLIGLMSGIDVRSSGSGNVGATNVARVVGKSEGIATLLGDAAKGLVPVLLAFALVLPPAAIAGAGLAAFLGHVFPIFLKFKGGKGVATAFGVLLGLAPLAAFLLAGVFALVFLVTRTVSLSSMATAVATPVVLWLSSYPVEWLITGVLLAAIVILRHHENIRRIMAGTEPKFES